MQVNPQKINLWKVFFQEPNGFQANIVSGIARHQKATSGKAVFFTPDGFQRILPWQGIKYRFQVVKPVCPF